jgi:glycosyltransferase involved in cell wall biosynthesis
LRRFHFDIDVRSSCSAERPAFDVALPYLGPFLELMPKAQTLLVPLGSHAAARGAIPTLGGDELEATLRLPMLGTSEGRRLLAQRYERVVITGSPPAAEIGFGLATLIVPLVRARDVILVDDRTGDTTVIGTPTFLPTALPRALYQLAASAAAVPAQRLAATVVRQGRPPGQRSGSLSRMLYLRPTVGSGASFGGSVTHAHELIRAFRELGIDVVPLTTDDAIAATAEEDPDPPCHWKLLKVGISLNALPASAAVADDLALVLAGIGTNADVIYQRHARFSLCGAVLARVIRRPLFLEYNASEAFTGKYWNKTPLTRQLGRCERAVLSTASRIFVVSEVGRRELIGRGIPPERIVLNPNGVSPDRFASGGGMAVRGDVGLSPEDIVVGFVGTFGPWHGAPLLARSLARLWQDMPRLRALFVGDGPEWDQTRQEIGVSGGDGAARFVGRVRPSDIPRYLDACDILVSPQVPLPDGIEFFGSPTKLFEYMAAGKGIVASRLGQIGEVLEHGRTALLVEPGDEAALSAAISKLARAPKLRAQLGAAARERARERHTWTASARRVVEAYDELEAITTA